MAYGRPRHTLTALAALAAMTAANFAATPAAAAPAPAAGTATTAALATMMHQATGYTPSQVTAAPACDVPAPGRAGCDAEALVTKTTGRPVRPLRRVTSAAAADSAVTSPSAAVQSGSPALFTPAYIQEAYDTGWLSATAGAGETVAIVDAYGDTTAVSDLATFRADYGLPALSACGPSGIATHTSGGPCLTVANQSGQTSPLPSENGSDPWEPEMALDLDAVSSMCPNCNILLIETNSDYDNDLAAGDAEALRLGVKLISNSFGGPGSGDGDYYTAAEAATGDQAGAETFASTGDDGAYVGDQYPGQTSATQVPYPASEPGITAVGGTSIAPAANARGVAESAWSGAGSACSSFDAKPAWQDSANTGCSGRAVADVSADADPDTGLTIYDSYDGGWATYGGTSLAAPLTAAYVALTGVNASSTANADGSLSAQWAYADAPKLNDITSGSNGTCPPSTSYASSQTCNAGTGWDGPTGMGSISGDVIGTAAGPSLTVPPEGGVDNGGNGYSIVQSLSGTRATFDGGAYPNGSSTSVWWEYGTSDSTDGGTNFSSATSTSSQSLGSGSAAVAATAQAVNELSSGSVYFVEECASNHSGADTTCGNVTEFTTGSGPDAIGPATIAASSLGYGGQLSLSGGQTWTSGAALTYQWQESSDGVSWSDIGGASATPIRYTLQSSDSQKYLRLEVSAADGSGTTTDYSNVLRAGPMPPAASTPTLSDTDLGLGGLISVGAPTWAPAAQSVTYQWQESSNGTSGWTALTSASATDTGYTIQLSDSNQYIRAEIIGSNGNGSTTLDTAPVQVQDLTTGSAGSSSGSAVAITSPPSVGGQASVGSRITVSGGVYTNAGPVTVTFERCARTCTVVQSGSSSSYRLQPSDAGYYLVTIVHVAGTGGAASASTTATGTIGPVRSPTAGVLRVIGPLATLKSGANRVLLRVRRTIIRAKKRTRAATYVLTLTRPARLTGRLRAWACVQAGSRLVSCSRPLNVARTATIGSSVPAGDRLVLIAVA